MPKSYCHLSDLERAQIQAHLELGSKVHQPRAQALRLARPHSSYTTRQTTHPRRQRLLVRSGSQTRLRFSP